MKLGHLILYLDAIIMLMTYRFHVACSAKQTLYAPIPVRGISGTLAFLVLTWCVLTRVAAELVLKNKVNKYHYESNVNRFTVVSTNEIMHVNLVDCAINTVLSLRLLHQDRQSANRFGWFLCARERGLRCHISSALANRRTNIKNTCP